MNWKIKALSHLILSSTPICKAQLRYYLQRKICKSLPRSQDEFANGVASAIDHINAFTRYSPMALNDARFFEFGTGWDLLSPLVFWCLGVNQQTLIDIWRFVDCSLINLTIKFLGTCHEIELVRKPQRNVRPNIILRDLENYYGIKYLAPVDARSTGFQNGSFDCVTSTFTM